MGYGTGEMAPGGNDLAIDPYTAAHNVLLSHAEAYHRYADTYKASQKGQHRTNTYFPAEPSRGSCQKWTFGAPKTFEALKQYFDRIKWAFLRRVLSHLHCVVLYCMLLFLSYPFLLLAHSPDIFSPNLLFPKGGLFCVALLFFVF